MFFILWIALLSRVPILWRGWRSFVKAARSRAPPEIDALEKAADIARSPESSRFGAMGTKIADAAM
jgi:hypothetical protein